MPSELDELHQRIRRLAHEAPNNGAMVLRASLKDGLMREDKLVRQAERSIEASTPGLPMTECAHILADVHGEVASIYARRLLELDAVLDASEGADVDMDCQPYDGPLEYDAKRHGPAPNTATPSTDRTDT